MSKIANGLWSRWYSFWYNFGWSNYVGWLDGWIPRFSYAVPMIGYLILFNDSVSQHLTFANLTSGHSALGLTGGARLKFLYVGLILLGFANILYRWRRPYPLKFAKDQFTYVQFGLRNFTPSNFIEFHGRIRGSDSDPLTMHGKYTDREWSSFLEHALGISEVKPGNWEEAKSKYGAILQGILIETFFREDTTSRRVWLIACLVIASCGYALLAVPSVDLFLKVMAAIVSSLPFG